jgi:hypothetical protein
MSSDVLESLLKALFGWNTDDAIHIVIDLLQGPLSLLDGVGLANGEKGGDESEDWVTTLEKARFRFRLLDLIAMCEPLRAALLAHEAEEASGVFGLLADYRTYAEQRLETDDKTAFPDRMLIVAVEMYYRLCVHVTFAQTEEEVRYYSCLFVCLFVCLVCLFGLFVCLFCTLTHIIEKSYTGRPIGLVLQICTS